MDNPFMNCRYCDHPMSECQVPLRSLTGARNVVGGEVACGTISLKGGYSQPVAAWKCPKCGHAVAKDLNPQPIHA
jgi:rubrerythrin